MTKKLTVLLLTSLLIAGTNCIAAPATTQSKEKKPAATTGSPQADDQLYKDMEKVRDRLNRYLERVGHFPKHGEEMGHALARLNRAAPVNPYESPENGKKVKARVAVLVDHALAKSTVEKFESKLAPFWSAEPGQITVLTNGKDLMLLWGAGMDSKPIKDQKTGKLRLVVADLPAPREAEKK